MPGTKASTIESLRRGVSAPRSRRARRGAGPCVLLLVLSRLASSVLGGTITLSWTPVTDSDVAGYKIFYGTSPGAYTRVVDVRDVTRYTIAGLSDCTRYVFAAKAYDRAGNLSAQFSRELSGMSDPRVASVAPSSAERGQSLTVTAVGSNFDQGASLAFSDRISVYATNYVSCTQVHGTVEPYRSIAIQLEERLSGRGGSPPLRDGDRSCGRFDRGRRGDRAGPALQ